MANRYAVRPKGNKPRLSASGRLSSAAQAVGVLTPGCRVVGLTMGQFSLLDLIAAVLVQVGPADVLVSTWTPGRQEMERVADMLDAHAITGFRLLVDRSFVSRHPEYVARIQRMLGSETIRQTRTHAKFALVRGGGYQIAIRTSMNFNRNPRFEQFDLDDDPVIYDFFDGFARLLYESAPTGLDASQKEVHRVFSGFSFRGLGDPLMEDGAVADAGEDGFTFSPVDFSMWDEQAEDG